MDEWYSIVYTYHIFIIHPSIRGGLGCFHVLAVVNSAAVNIWVHVSFRIMVSSAYMPSSGIPGSYSSFNHRFFFVCFFFLRNICSGLQSLWSCWYYFFSSTFWDHFLPRTFTQVFPLSQMLSPGPSHAAFFITQLSVIDISEGSFNSPPSKFKSSLSQIYSVSS